MRLSKSQFIRGLQCSKSLWLYKYQRELQSELKDSQQSLFGSGTNVGILAQQLFPEGKEIIFDPEKIHENTGKTLDLIRAGATTIYEATFVFDDVLVLADILHYGDKGWELYEVKSSTSVKDVYENDIALQYYVIKGSGLSICKAAIVHINNRYVRQGDLDLKQLFTIADLSNTAMAKQEEIIRELSRLKITVAKGSAMPEMDIGPHCNDPYECDFSKHCWQHIPPKSVFSLSRMRSSDKFKLYGDGIISFADIPVDYPLTKAQQMQVDAELNGTEFINIQGIKALLATITSPVGFMDFETFMQAVPSFNNQSPYQQIPFQFSLHIDDGSGPLRHVEYLGEQRKDPRLGFINLLLSATENIPVIIVYNKAFECRILTELAQTFPQYSQEINDLINRVVDLMVPFQNKDYYVRKMQGRYSIKLVLPSLVPEMSYESMAIADGGAAMDAYAALQDIDDDEEITIIRQDLLKYCELDTLAMVKIVEKLRAVVV
ncbi:MAG: DUF2779 domain-containing protein [Chlorobium sp.]|nr:DUF2779 domain-containing protein [Chlorobium sp.]